MSITDLNHYAQEADLQLCLSLIEDACSELQNKNYDLAEAQLLDILETFDELSVTTDESGKVSKHTFSNVISLTSSPRE